MAYVARYMRKSDGAAAVRLITRGFSCTRGELQREIATRCGAVVATLSWVWVDGSTDAGEILVNHAKNNLGYVVDK
jgi:hypothetical protein